MDLKNSFIFKEEIQQQMVDICKPLESLGILYFFYIKAYNNGKGLYLTNRSDVLNSMIENNLIFKQYSLFKQEVENLSQADLPCFIWTGLPKNKLQETFYKLNIGNIITFYNKINKYTEVYGFGAHKENDKIINFYINNINLANQFLIYFKEKASYLINIEDERKLLFGYPIQTDNISKFSIHTQDAKIKTFFKNIPITTYHLTDKISLTRREFECLFHLSKGKTVKEIAKIINLSPRTVESYIENAARKAQCNRKSQIIDLFLNSSLSKNLTIV